MNGFNRSTIDNKVKARMDNSSLASSSIGFYKSNRTDRFLDENDNKISFLETRSDATLNRAKERYAKQEMIMSNNLSKFITKEKPGVTRYYNSYVE